MNNRALQSKEVGSIVVLGISGWFFFYVFIYLCLKFMCTVSTRFSGGAAGEDEGEF